MTRIKVCCISSNEEAKLAIQNGASAIGLVSEMPSGPGIIAEKQIIEIAATTPPGVSSFLLTSKQDINSIIDQQKRCGANTIQLVDTLEQGTLQDLREALPGIRIVQVIHVKGEESLNEAVALQNRVDALLLDSGSPEKAVKELGGTGRTHNWLISRRIVEAVKLPVFLAGGLKPANIFEAIQTVRPFGVDVCSGIRTEDKLDEAKLKQFCAEVRAADFD
jgi:phosphoribosylanthranilate isomerase